MVDKNKHIEYWRLGAEDALDSAEKLIAQGKVQHGLFFAHLAIEKILKAHVCQTTGDIAPFIHNLARLAEFAMLNIDKTQEKTLEKINRFNIEGRYEDFLDPTPSLSDGREYFENAKEIYQWLTEQL